MRRKLSVFLLAFLLLSLLLPLTAAAAQSGGSLSYVTDAAGILTEEQRQELEETAARISERYQCGVYIVTTPDYRDFNQGSIENCAEGIYDQFALGFGETRDGILLLMSMADRDFDLDAHGSFGNYAFSSSGRASLVDAFRGPFGSDDWYGGFRAFLDRAESLLIPAEQSYPEYLEQLRREQEPHMSAPKLIGAAAAGCLSAAGVCGGMKRQMKTAKEKTTAEEYLLPGNPHLNIRNDRFINATRTVQIIETNRDSGGGGGHSGGGYSGHSHTSGKF